MVRFAESEVCRRIPLLAYFGETHPHETCGRCDNCLAGERELQDITIPAQKFLSCVKRTRESFGIAHLINVLRGSRAEKILRFGHDQLSTYGIGKDLSRRQWEQVARQLLHKELMVQDPEIGSLSLTENAWDVLRGTVRVLGRLDEAVEPVPALEKATGEADAPYDRELFEALRRKRREIAEADGVPPYVVFSDRSLAEMARRRPQDLEAFAGIRGVGQFKLERYGPVFIQVIEEYCRDRSIEPVPAPEAPFPGRVRGSLRKLRERAVSEAFNTGQRIENLAREHNVGEARILDYLHHSLLDGRPLRTEALLAHMPRAGSDPDRVMSAFDTFGPERLKPIHDAFEGDFSYDELRILRLHYLNQLLPEGGFLEQEFVGSPTACRIICLANSRKYSGRCIAGKQWVEGVVGGWVRPVSGEGTGELTRDQITLRGGGMPELLDLIAVPLLDLVSDGYQSENRPLAGGRWVRSARWPAERVGELLDDVDRLWINGHHSSSGHNDRMPTELVTGTLASSLLFIRVSRLAFTVVRDNKGLNRVRARFVYNGEDYWIPVTDPTLETQYLPRDVGEYPAEAPEVCVTVSISEPYDGYCYKLASAFIGLTRGGLGD